MKQDLMNLYQTLGTLSVSGQDDVKRLAGCFVLLEKLISQIDTGELKVSYKERGDQNAVECQGQKD